MPTGMPISILGDHADQPLENGKLNASHLVNSSDGVRKAVREQFEKGTFLSPTLIADHQIAVYGKGKMTDFSYQKMCQHVDAFCEHVGKAIKAGIKLALGTDTATFMNPLENSAKEFSKAGATNYQALRAVGLGSAELLKID